MRFTGMSGRFSAMALVVNAAELNLLIWLRMRLGISVLIVVGGMGMGLMGVMGRMGLGGVMGMGLMGRMGRMGRMGLGAVDGGSRRDGS